MNYQVIKHDRFFVVVKINPTGYTAKLFGGRRYGVLSLSSSYSWKGQRIGRVKELLNKISSHPSHDELRPVFLFGSTSVDILHPKDEGFKEVWQDASVAFQAGPTLIWDGKVDIRSKEEIFQGDAVRRTQHVAIGITQHNKIIALYAANASMLTLAKELLSYDCIKAMKCDGGHMAHLHLLPDTEDTISPPISVGPYALATGITFMKKVRKEVDK